MNLSPTRRAMLRMVAYSEVTRSYNGALEPSYATEIGWADGHGKNALSWLELNGFIRCLGEPNFAGLKEGLMRPTGKGSTWLADNRIRG